MSVDCGGMAPPFGRHDAEVGDRLMQLGPLPVAEVLLGRQHEARSPALRRYSPRAGSKERFIKGPVERPKLERSSGRLCDLVKPLPKLAGYYLGGWGDQNVRESEPINGEGFIRSPAPEIRLPGVAERLPPDDLSLRIPPGVPDLDDSVRPRGPTIMPEPRRLGVDHYDLRYGSG